MPYVSSIDNENIYYEILGNGDISLVFVGGWLAPTGKETWKYQLDFASKYKIVLVDLSGYGKSSNGRKNHTMNLYGHDIKAVVEKLNLNAVILIGISMGGAVILEAEVLISTRTIGLIPIDSLFPESHYERRNEEEIANIMKPYEDDFGSASKNLLYSLISDKFNPKDVEDWENAIEQMDKDAMNSALRELVKWDFRDILLTIKKPIKCIVSQKTLPQENQRKRYTKIFDTVFINDVGHLMNLEDPEKFNSALNRRIEEFASVMQVRF
jgi:pimeloyl-ACP methyl ester carboxylesterase